MIKVKGMNLITPLIKFAEKEGDFKVAEQLRSKLNAI